MSKVSQITMVATLARVAPPVFRFCMLLYSGKIVRVVKFHPEAKGK